jgi:hypothetical protein
MCTYMRQDRADPAYPGGPQNEALLAPVRAVLAGEARDVPVWSRGRDAGLTWSLRLFGPC